MLIPFVNEALRVCQVQHIKQKLGNEGYEGCAVTMGCVFITSMEFKGISIWYQCCMKVHSIFGGTAFNVPSLSFDSTCLSW